MTVGDEIAAYGAIIAACSAVITLIGVVFAAIQIRWSAAGTSIANLVLQQDRIHQSMMACVSACRSKDREELNVAFGLLTNNLELAAVSIFDGALGGNAKETLKQHVYDVRKIIRGEEVLERLYMAHRPNFRTFNKLEKLIAKMDKR